MIHFLGLACVVFGLVLCTYYFLLIIKKNHQKSAILIDEANAVEIVKLLEALREVCPPGAYGWTLLFSSIGLRCWWRKFPFKFLDSEINVYASSTIINTPAVSVLNVVADISTWPEWDPVCQNGRQLEAELSEDPDLHGDKYMQCDQVVTMMVGQMPKPGILMHRFGNLESNGVGWLLLWHTRRLDWTFFLAQPTDHSPLGHDHSCLVTMVRGCNPYQKCREDLLNQVSCKLRNLKEALEISCCKFRPLLPMVSVPSHTLENPHFPTVRSALVDMSEKPCLLLRPESAPRHRNNVLAAVPFGDSKPIALQNLKGYVLVPWRVSESADSEMERHKSNDRPTRRRPSRNSKSISRGESFKTEGMSKQSIVASSAKTASSSSSSSSSPTPERKGKLAIGSPGALFSHLFRRRSSEQSGFGATDEEFGRINSSVLSSLLQKSTALGLSALIQPPNESAQDEANDVQETFLLVPDLPSGYDGDYYKSIGATCASQVVTEVLNASVIDITVPQHEQKKLTGGWVCEGIHKEVLVLTKLSSDGASKTVSYLSKGMIPASAAFIWKAVCNPLTRFMYDETVKQVSVVQELSAEQQIVYAYHESISLLKKEAQDFCLLHTQNVLGASYVLTLQSVDHGRCPSEKDAVRGTMLPSGWIIEPLPENASYSIVTYLIQVAVQTSESLLVEEMGTMQSISNLRRYLIPKPKKRF